MRSLSLAAAALALASGCRAFSETTPVLAWSTPSSDGEAARSLLLINVPGLHLLDLQDLASEATSSIRAAWDASPSDQRVHLPYVQKWHHPVLQLEEKLPCAAQATEIDAITFDAFEQPRVDRKRAMRQLDELVAQQTTTFEGSRVYAIVSHSELDIDALRLRKRQAIEYESSRPTLQQEDDDGGDSDGGNNSTWKPDPNAPALARYSIINPTQIVVLLILILIFVPAIVWTISMLTDISLPYGLTSGKMKGDTASKEKKDQ